MSVHSQREQVVASLQQSSHRGFARRIPEPYRVPTHSKAFRSPRLDRGPRSPTLLHDVVDPCGLCTDFIGVKGLSRTETSLAKGEMEHRRLNEEVVRCKVVVFAPCCDGYALSRVPELYLRSIVSPNELLHYFEALHLRRLSVLMYTAN